MSDRAVSDCKSVENYIEMYLKMKSLVSKVMSCFKQKSLSVGINDARIFSFAYHVSLTIAPFSAASLGTNLSLLIHIIPDIYGQ